MNSRRVSITGVTLGLVAGLAYGISTVLIRQGVVDMAPPLVGAVISLFSGTLGMAVLGMRKLDRSYLVQNKKGIVFLLISGVAASLGIMFSFVALSVAPVVIVSPLQSTNPLFTMLFSYFFIGHLEKITPRLLLGSLLLVGGVILIAVGRAA